MKQLHQSLKNGETNIVELPIQYPSKGKVLISSINSIVSVGTEKMLVITKKASVVRF